MNKRIKKLLAGLLAVLLMITSAPLGDFVGLNLELFDFSFKANAGVYTVSFGEEEDNLVAVFNTETGEVRIEGQGSTGEYDYKFWNMKDVDKIKTIIIGEGVTYIGGSIFDAFDNLERFEVDLNNKNYLSEDGVLFNKDKSTLLLYPMAKTEASYAIPSSVEIISDSAFANCDNLEKVAIPDGVTRMENFAFNRCKKLESVIMPNSITEIGMDVFECCTSLKSITLSENLTVIPDHTFTFCVNLESVTIPDSVTSIGVEAIGGCANLKSVIIGSGVKDIIKNFELCPRLESITVDKDNQYFSSENGVLFNKDKTELICYPSSKKDYSYEIPNTVELLGESLSPSYFTKELVIPESTTYIDSNIRLYGLKDVYIYNDSIEIDDNSLLCRTDTDYDNMMLYFEEYMDLFFYNYLTGGLEQERLDYITNEMFLDEIVPSGTIHAREGSTAQVYAEKYGINFVPLEDTCTNHTESDWIIDKNATCEETGLKHTECTECGEKIKEEIIPALGHKDEDGDGLCDNCKGKYMCQENCFCHKGNIFSKIVRLIYTIVSMVFGRRITCCSDMVFYLEGISSMT